MLAEDWARCREYLLPALDLCQGAYAEKDIVDGILSGAYQFFAGKNAALITSFAEYPRCRAIHFFLAGGDKDELVAMERKVVAWAKTQGCTRAEFSGRRGWIRALPDYKELCTVGYKEIAS